MDTANVGGGVMGVVAGCGMLHFWGTQALRIIGGASTRLSTAGATIAPTSLSVHLQYSTWQDLNRQSRLTPH